MKIFSVGPNRIGPYAACSLLALTSLANAGSFHAADTYSGGTNSYNVGDSTHGDVIANDVSGANFPTKSAFQIFSMDITRSGNNLSVTINTNYANHVGFLGTGLGALFIGSGTPNYLGSSANNYATDTFRNDPGRFDYAVQIDAGITPSGTNGSSTLYSLDGTLGDVQQSWHGNTSTINGTTFRQGQAVGVKATADKISAAAQWTLTQGTDGVDGAGGGRLTFDVTDFFSIIPGLNNGDMTLAWAMTCGNDVILTTLSIPPEGPPTNQTPLPGALSLFATGLGGLGLMTWRRHRKSAAA